MGIDSNPYVYFMYSYEHIQKRDEVAAKLGSRFICGTVVIKGTKKKYSFMSTDKTFLDQYPDAKIVAEGYKKQMVYTDCGTELRGGN